MSSERARREARRAGWVVPDPVRCVQCGICSYCCPIEIDVRRHAWRGDPVKDRHCLTCGECVARCPRGVLRFERIESFEGAGTGTDRSGGPGPNAGTGALPGRGRPAAKAGR